MKKHNTSKHIYQAFFLLITISVLLTFSKAHAQANITLTGLVVDDGTQLALSGATVHIKGTTFSNPHMADCRTLLSVPCLSALLLSCHKIVDGSRNASYLFINGREPKGYGKDLFK